MKDHDNIVVRRDDLTVMISAIENMLISLNLLGSSLAGMIPDQILPAQLPLIAENLLSFCFPGIPYNIYAYSTEAYSAQNEAAIRRLLLFIPAIPSIITCIRDLDYIELHIEDDDAVDDTLLALSFSETVIDSDRKKINEQWENLPERIRRELMYRFQSKGGKNILTIQQLNK